MPNDGTQSCCLQNEELELQYKTSYARILDAKRRFLEASQRYYELSQIGNRDINGLQACPIPHASYHINLPSQTCYVTLASCAHEGWQHACMVITVMCWRLLYG